LLQSNSLLALTATRTAKQFRFWLAHALPAFKFVFRFSSILSSFAGMDSGHVITKFYANCQKQTDFYREHTWYNMEWNIFKNTKNKLWTKSKKTNGCKI